MDPPTCTCPNLPKLVRPLMRNELNECNMFANLIAKMKAELEWVRLAPIGSQYGSCPRQGLGRPGPTRPSQPQARPSPAWLARFLDSKSHKMEILQTQISSAQKVGKDQMSRNKNFPASFEAMSGKFPHGPNNAELRIWLVFFLVVQWLLLFHNISSES